MLTNYQHGAMLCDTFGSIAPTRNRTLAGRPRPRAYT